jgi:hypothetical protein
MKFFGGGQERSLHQVPVFTGIDKLPELTGHNTLPRFVTAGALGISQSQGPLLVPATMRLMNSFWGGVNTISAVDNLEPLERTRTGVFQTITVGGMTSGNTKN